MPRRLSMTRYARNSYFISLIMKFNIPSWKSCHGLVTMIDLVVLSSFRSHFGRKSSHTFLFDSISSRILGCWLKLTFIGPRFWTFRIEDPSDDPSTKLANEWYVHPYLFISHIPQGISNLFLILMLINISDFWITWRSYLYAVEKGLLPIQPDQFFNASICEGLKKKYWSLPHLSKVLGRFKYIVSNSHPFRIQIDFIIFVRIGWWCSEFPYHASLSGYDLNLCESAIEVPVTR